MGCQPTTSVLQFIMFINFNRCLWVFLCGPRLQGWVHVAAEYRRQPREVGGRDPEHVLRKIHHCTFRAEIRQFSLYSLFTPKNFYFIQENFWWPILSLTEIALFQNSLNPSNKPWTEWVLEKWSSIMLFVYKWPVLVVLWPLFHFTPRFLLSGTSFSFLRTCSSS